MKENSHRPAIVTGTAEKESKGKKELDEITVKPVVNGFVVKERYRTAGKESYMSDYSPKESVFESAEDAMKHVGTCMGMKAAGKPTGHVTKDNNGMVSGKA